MKEDNFVILSKCKNGKVFRCQSCDKIHVEYKNFYFSFNEEEYEFFKNFFMKYNYDCDEGYTRNKLCKRRLKVSVGHPNLVALFSHHDLDELKGLLGAYKKHTGTFKLIEPKAINKKFSSN